MSPSSTSKPRRIALVDDDKLQIRFYLESLSALGYDTKLFVTPRSISTKLSKGELFDLYIVDLMIPSRGFYKGIETHDDLLTGILVTETIRRTDTDSPILIFTNMIDPEHLALAKRMLKEIDGVCLLRKIDLTPSEFAAAVSDLFSGASIDEITNDSIFKKVLNAIILRPSIGGVGIDLKALFSRKQ